MEFHRKKEFDPIFETLGLLYSSCQKNDKDEVIAVLNELGLDGEKFYRKHFRLLERYLKAFEKKMRFSPEYSFLFRDKDEEFFLVLVVLVVENREWLQSMDKVTDDDIRSQIAFFIHDDSDTVIDLGDVQMPVLKNEAEIISYLKEIDLNESDKWHYLELMQKPRYYMELLLEAVRENIPAYEYALREVSKALEPYWKSYEKFEDEQFIKLRDTCAPGADIYPTLVGGTSQMVYYTSSYHGIFAQFLLKKSKKGDEQREMLTARLKALSDKSKLDILCTLKESPKYNLELAEAMKLSASTMSHHMSVLFACGLVGVEKKDGKVYYCMEKEKVEEFISELEELLL